MGLEFDGVNGIIKNTTSDGDVTIKGNDGGSEISLLAFDVSAEGVATFNSKVGIKDSAPDVLLHVTQGGEPPAEGMLILEANSASRQLRIQPPTDADNGFIDYKGGNLTFLDDGTEVARFQGSTGFGIGTSTVNSKLEVAGNATITTADNTDTLKLVSTDADANPGPVLNYYRNSGSAADNDYIGRNIFTFNNDAPEIETALAQNVIMTDVSNGSEDVKYIQEQMTAGSVVERFTISASEAVFNEGSVDVDFRVESNGNTHMLFVDGGNNRVGIATTPDLGVGLHIRTGDSGIGSIAAGGDELVIEGSGDSGMHILSGASSDGNIFFGDSGDADNAYITYDHSTAHLHIGHGGLTKSNAMLLFHGSDLSLATNGELSGDAGRGGICLNQGGGDGNIFTLKSSDVAHPFTNISETDTYLRIRKFDGGTGGFEMDGYRAGNCAIEFNAYCSTESDTKTVNATAAMRFNSALTNGSTGANPISSNDNLCAWFNDGAAKMILDAEGDLHLDGSTAAYDAYEDAHLVRAYDLSHGKGVIDSKFDKFISYNHEKLADMRLVGREDDGTPNHFINVTGMQRLHNGAIWQQYEKTERLANAMYELAKAAVGEEKANEILKQNEIKLLN